MDQVVLVSEKFIKGLFGYSLKCTNFSHRNGLDPSDIEQIQRPADNALLLLFHFFLLVCGYKNTTFSKVETIFVYFVSNGRKKGMNGANN